MDTETKFLATVEQAEELVKQLQTVITKVKKEGNTSYVRMVLEQMNAHGPWGLTIGVSKP